MIDAWYYETIPNGSLKQGLLTNGGSISSDWSSIGDYSIKTDLENYNWVAYRISHPIIEKKGILELDYNVENLYSTIQINMTINGTARYINQRIANTDNTVTISFDFTEYEGAITVLEIRVYRYSSYTDSVYLDNIRVYSD